MKSQNGRQFWGDSEPQIGASARGASAPMGSERVFLTSERLSGGHTVVVFQLPKLTARVRFPSPALFLLFFLLSGCATTEYHPLPEIPERRATPAPSSQTQVPVPIAGPKAKAVYHKVVKGQTLWRIAKLYGVSVDDIIQSNKIPNAAAVEVNQLLLIPGANEAKDIQAKVTDEKVQEFAWPLRGKVISYFNDRKGDISNRGVDIEVAEGDTVKAVREGVIVLADYVSGYGQTIFVDHGDGFMSIYAQNRKLLSKTGDHVDKGDPIAEVGRSGRRSLFHFEIRKGPKAVNPLYYLPS